MCDCLLSLPVYVRPHALYRRCRRSDAVESKHTTTFFLSRAPVLPSTAITSEAVASWNAHDDGIISMQVGGVLVEVTQLMIGAMTVHCHCVCGDCQVILNPAAVVTSCFDKHVCLWSQHGKLLGSLQQQPPPTPKTEPHVKHWHFVVGTSVIVWHASAGWHQNNHPLRVVFTPCVCSLISGNGTYSFVMLPKLRSKWYALVHCPKVVCCGRGEPCLWVVLLECAGQAKRQSCVP